MKLNVSAHLKVFLSLLFLTLLIPTISTPASASSVKGTCGSSALYDANGLYWSIHPNRPVAYTAFLEISVYKGASRSGSYVTSEYITTYGSGGASGSSGIFNPSSFFPELDPGAYYAELTGSVAFLDHETCTLGDGGSLYAGTKFYHYGGVDFKKPEEQ
ncbi:MULTISPECIES: hypothetical protein [unclassified Paenibacillus]|uniref:hypothetical protein n=1 Tax=unclassified Paenibacillus TaxID=185978 RepID=UPI00034E69FD|nr:MULTISPECIES: hypothetical protein [unclassified Paenibacillus]EPD82006.1 hypothetical protein HMPREF1207_03832 [Paenibacillus sp. HGH0039]